MNETVLVKGYTLAADMWSVGAMTTAILTGVSIFLGSQPQECSSEAGNDAASKCDLNKMNNRPEWQSVSLAAKCFVRHVLILDEIARPKVDDALQHPWFTEVGRKDVLSALYKKVTAGWFSTKALWDFEEDLDVFMNGRGLDSKVFRLVLYIFISRVNEIAAPKRQKHRRTALQCACFGPAFIKQHAQRWLDPQSVLLAI